MNPLYLPGPWHCCRNPASRWDGISLNRVHTKSFSTDCDYLCSQWFYYRPVFLPSDVKLWSVFPGIISKVIICRRETPHSSGTMAVCDDRLYIFVFKYHIWELLDECCLVLVTSWHLTCLFIFSLIFSVCLLIDLVPLNDLVRRMGVGIKHFQQEMMKADIWASLARAYTWP